MKREDVTDLIYDSCALLDVELFDDWLNLCANEFAYLITTYSDELGKEMIWMTQDKSGMAHVFGNVKNHERYTGKLRRHLSMPRIKVSNEKLVSVSSPVAVYHTETNGVSQLYAIGSYRDVVQESQGRLLLARREVVLDTRRLVFGSHVPI